MVAEKNDARSIVHLRVLAYVVLKKNGRHRRHVLMAEAQIGLGKPRVTRLHAGHANAALFLHHMPRENLLRHGHRPFAGVDRRQPYLLLHPRHIKRKQPAVFNHLPRNLVFAHRKLAQRDLFAAANLIDQRKVGRSQNSEILAILLVDALNIFRNHQPNAGTHLRIRRLLPARSFTAPLSAQRAHKAAALHVTPPNRRLAAAFQPKVGNLAQCLVKVEAVMRRSNLVGRDVITQLGIVGGILRVPWQTLAGKLPLNELGIFREEKNSSLQPDFVRPLFDFAFQKRVDHIEPARSEIGITDSRKRPPSPLIVTPALEIRFDRRQPENIPRGSTRKSYRLYSRGSGSGSIPRPAKITLNSSSNASCNKPLEANVSRLLSSKGEPSKRVTLPPASSTISTPAAVSQGLRLNSQKPS